MNRVLVALVVVLVLAVGVLGGVVLNQSRRIAALERGRAVPSAVPLRTADLYPRGETREQYIDRQVRQILQDRKDTEEVRRRVEAASR